MTLRDIYYYFVAFAMMAGVLIANLFNLDIEQKSNGRISISFAAADNSRNHMKNNVLAIWDENGLLNVLFNILARLLLIMDDCIVSYI